MQRTTPARIAPPFRPRPSRARVAPEDLRARPAQPARRDQLVRRVRRASLGPTDPTVRTAKPASASAARNSKEPKRDTARPVAPNLPPPVAAPLPATGKKALPG